MTSPVRQRRDRSRKRLAHAESLEIVENARTVFCSQQRGDSGASLEPITRGDLVLVRRAICGGWDVPEAKRGEIIQRIGLALDGDNDRLVIAAAKTMLMMEASNLLNERTG